MRIDIGPFTLESPIGRGGMGEVWRARHTSRPLAVAIKLLTQQGARKPDYVKAFRNEVASISRLHHPGIISVLDYGVISPQAELYSRAQLVAGSPYLVMELAELGSLERYEERLCWRELRAILLTTLDALSHAHARGIVHRDLKPQNILIGCGASYHVKLSDFGLAHATSYAEAQQEADTYAGWGTPAYMAPEQFRGSWRDYGPWTDLYALGCMAYELCSGEFPFTAEAREELERAHLLQPVPRLLPRFALPEGFEPWLLRLLQKRPSDRFQRAADASLALLALPAHPPHLHDDPRSATTFRLSAERVLPDPQRALAYLTARLDPCALKPKLYADRRRAGQASALNLPPDATTAPRGDHELTTTQRPPRQSAREAHAALEERLDSDSFEPGVSPQQMSSIAPIAPSPINLPPMPLSWRAQIGQGAASPPERVLGAGVGLYDLLEPRLIGRDIERDLLWHALREVDARGQPRAVLLCGDSGLGKSKLAQWLARRAHELGVAHVMRAMHSPRRTRFDGLSAMLAHYLRVQDAPDEERRRRVRDHLEASGCVDESLGEALDMFIAPQALSMSQRRAASTPLARAPAHRRLHTLRAFLEHESATRALIVVLDDVQWAPEALLAVQHLLTSRLALSRRALPVLFMMTLCDDELEEGSLEALMIAQIAALSACTRHRVEPLLAEESRQLVRALLHTDEALTEAIVERARGVPLFAVQLLGELTRAHKLALHEGGFALADGVELSLPDDIHELWQRRVARCLARHSGTTLHALELAAALGQDLSLFEWRALCEALDLDLPEELLEGLQSDGLIAVEQDCVAFSHDLLRQSMERGARQRGHWRRYNEAIAEALLKSSASKPLNARDTARLAEHLILAERFQEALKPLADATRDALAQGDLALSQALLSRRDHALEQDPTPELEPQRVVQSVLRSALCTQQGLPRRAREWGVEAMRLAHQGGHAQLWDEAALMVAFSSLQSGQVEQASELIALVRDRFADAAQVPTIFLAWCDIAEARLAQLCGELKGAVEHFTRALARLPSLGFPSAMMSTCYNGLGDIYRAQGDLHRAGSFTREALELARRHDNPTLMADCYNDLSDAARASGDLLLARQHAERAIALDTTHSADQSLRAYRNVGFICLLEGQIEEAERLFDALYDHLRPLGASAHMTFVTAGLLVCAAERGDALASIEALLSQLEELLAQTQLRSALIKAALAQANALAAARPFAQRFKALLDAQRFEEPAEEVKP